MQCKKHSGSSMPCIDCCFDSYTRCLVDNAQGKDPPHDLTELRKQLIKAGRKID